MTRCPRRTRRGGGRAHVPGGGAVREANEER